MICSNKQIRNARGDNSKKKHTRRCAIVEMSRLRKTNGIIHPAHYYNYYSSRFPPFLGRPDFKTGNQGGIQCAEGLPHYGSLYGNPSVWHGAGSRY